VSKSKSELHKNHGKVYIARLYNDHLETIVEEEMQKNPKEIQVKRKRCGT
jgi:hypothetical protein